MARQPKESKSEYRLLIDSNDNATVCRVEIRGQRIGIPEEQNLPAGLIGELGKLGFSKQQDGTLYRTVKLSAWNSLKLGVRSILAKYNNVETAKAV